MKRIQQCVKGCARPNLAGILEVAAEAAIKAGRILRDLYGQPHHIRYKGDIDLVSEADVSSEKTILEIVNKAPIDAEIIAEESQSSYNDIPTNPVWIIDPLDGTTNFVHGFPWFAVSIAYAEEGKSRVGVIYCPMQDELFCGCLGSGAWLNGNSIKVSGISTLGKSLLATGFPYNIHQKSAEVVATLKAVLIRAQGVRRAGAAAIDLACVACGRLEGFWEINLKPWDTAAGQILLEEAGGKLSDFRGNNYSPFIPELLATNSLIHKELVSVIRESTN
ncbi:MAG: inositol monophosphatase [Nitrospiraceae bacterium]|nr:inositol monophosphatase [Nitrospiraceae bacterium]